MAKVRNTTFGFTGRIAGHGITLYRRRGKVYARISTREVSDRQSMNQFKTREKMRHSIALWKCFHTPYKPLMTTSDGTIAYNAFLRANSALPTVYFTKQQAVQGAVLLMPGMVVSEGRLPKVEYDFAQLAGGERVVLTNLLTGIDEGETQELPIGCNDDLRQLLCRTSRNPQLMPGDRVRFYRLEQRLENDCPTVTIICCEMVLDNDPRQNPELRDWRFYSHKGRLAIGGADDENTPIQTVAIVRTKVNGRHVSPRGVMLRRYDNNVNRTAIYPTDFVGDDFIGIDRYLALDCVEDLDPDPENELADVEEVTYEIVKLPRPFVYDSDDGFKISNTNLNHYVYSASSEDEGSGSTSNEYYTVDQDVNEEFTVRYSITRDVPLEVRGEASSTVSGTTVSFLVPADRAVTKFWLDIDNHVYMGDMGHL